MVEFCIDSMDAIRWSRPGDGVLAKVGAEKVVAEGGLESEGAREVEREEAAHVGLTNMLSPCFGGEGTRADTER